MKKIIILCLLSFLLISCGINSQEPKEEKKGLNKPQREISGTGNTIEKKQSSNDFLIETKTIDELNNTTYIEKVGQVLSEQSINLKSQVSGRLSSIHVKQGDNVYQGQTLAKITDTYSKYYLDLDKAQIDYEKQIINKESQILSLDKKINDAEILLNEARLNFENAQLEPAEDSQSYLELQKAKLDYENGLNTNQQKIISYIDSTQSQYNSLSLSIGDIIKFSDELLGVTTENKSKNDDFENYLGKKDTGKLNQAKSELLELIEYNQAIKTLDVTSITQDNIVSFMENFETGYTNINNLLNSIELVLNNSITSIGSLSESDINQYISQINSYQNSNQGNKSNFISSKNTITTFLNTYKQSEESALQNVKIQSKKLQSSLNAYETKYKQAQATYDNTVANKEITIKSLDNTIASAKNTLDKAKTEYSKLTITSPITGIISSINIDNNVDVSNGTDLFTLISENNTQIEISLNSTEIDQVDIGDKVEIEYFGEIIKGNIYSKSRVANQNLEYNITINLDTKIQLVGGATIVKIISENQHPLLSLDIIEITEENRGFIYYYTDEKVEKLELNLGKINGGNIQVLSDIDEKIQIITTDLSTYNSLIQNLKINND